MSYILDYNPNPFYIEKCIFNDILIIDFQSITEFE